MAGECIAESEGMQCGRAVLLEDALARIDDLQAKLDEAYDVHCRENEAREFESGARINALIDEANRYHNDKMVAERELFAFKREVIPLFLDMFICGSTTRLKEQIEQWFTTVLSPVELADFKAKVEQARRANQGSIIPRGF